jgi:hypothetical protein
VGQFWRIFRFCHGNETFKKLSNLYNEMNIIVVIVSGFQFYYIGIKDAAAIVSACSPLCTKLAE